MKNTQIKIILAAAAIAATACTRMLPDLMVDASSQVISINPVAAVTKAGPIDGTVFPNSYNMVVSAYYNAAEGASGNYFSGITFSRNASTGRWDESKYWPMSGTLNLLAYSANDGTSNVVSAAPVYSAKNTDGVTLTVTDNRTAQVDILHSQVEEKVWEATGVPMQFKHAQAAVAFVAKSNVAYNATRNEGITITKITLNGAKYSGTLAISKTEAAGTAPENGYCVWTALGSQAAKDLPGVGAGYNVPAAYLDVTAAGNHFGIGSTGIMMPEQAQTSFTIFYTLHNGKASDGTTNLDNAMQYTHTLSGNWIEGKKYVYELNFTLNKIEVTPTVLDWNSETSEVQIPEPPATFAGLTFAAGPLAYEGGQYVIKDNWNYNSYRSAYGKTEGSTYFNFIEMGELFEKDGFTVNDVQEGHIKNIKDPFSGWRLPSSEEWAKVVTTDASERPGSTVNGRANAHWDLLWITGPTFDEDDDITGLLIFPDNKTITGKALSLIEDGGDSDAITLAELNTYIAQGCVFLPCFNGYNSRGTVIGGGPYGFYWSSSGDLTDGYYLYFDGCCPPMPDDVDTKLLYYCVRLVKKDGESPDSPDPVIPSGSFAYIWSDDPGAKITLESIASYPEDEHAWFDTGYPYDNCEISHDGINWEPYDETMYMDGDEYSLPIYLRVTNGINYPRRSYYINSSGSGNLYMKADAVKYLLKNAIPAALCKGNPTGAYTQCEKISGNIYKVPLGVGVWPEGEGQPNGYNPYYDDEVDDPHDQYVYTYNSQLTFE